LVRISPFSAQKLRHTSFAMVEILPQIKDGKEIEVNPADLKVDYFHASGPGGQYVNKRMSAVRITHMPTGIIVSAQTERSLGQNRETAMEMLYAKLFQLRMSQQQKELSQIKGSKISASWGNQIRSYVVHPYQLVKDLRTGVETSQAGAVLDGGLDEFITAEIQQNDQT
jgi:peptide chain release factor 2